MWASGLARASLLCSPFSRALCVPVVRLVQYSADRSTGVHCSRPTLGVYHTAPSLPVLWASGIRLVGPSRVVVSSRPTSMACMLLCRSFFCSLVSRARCCPGDWPAPRPAEQPAFCASRLAAYSAGQGFGSHCAQLIELLLQLITCLMFV